MAIRTREIRPEYMQGLFVALVLLLLHCGQAGHFLSVYHTLQVSYC
jgi:hypothetical protein